MRQYRHIWEQMREFVGTNWNTGRGKRNSYKAKEVLLMTMVTLKNGGKWDFHGRMFGINASTFERDIIKFIDTVAEHWYLSCVIDQVDRHTMKELIDGGRDLKTHKSARYATDVTFQPTWRLSGSLEEAKNILVGKTHYMGLRWRFLSWALVSQLFVVRIFLETLRYRHFLQYERNKWIGSTEKWRRVKHSGRWVALRIVSEYVGGTGRKRLSRRFGN